MANWSCGYSVGCGVYRYSITALWLTCWELWSQCGVWCVLVHYSHTVANWLGAVVTVWGVWVVKCTPWMLGGHYKRCGVSVLCLCRLLCCSTIVQFVVADIRSVLCLCCSTIVQFVVADIRSVLCLCCSIIVQFVVAVIRLYTTMKGSFC